MGECIRRGIQLLRVGASVRRETKKEGMEEIKRSGNEIQFYGAPEEYHDQIRKAIKLGKFEWHKGSKRVEAIMNEILNEDN